MEFDSMASWLVAINNTLLGDGSLVRAKGLASPGDLVQVQCFNRKLKGYVIFESTDAPQFDLSVVEANKVPRWAVNRVKELLETYPLNAFELLDLAKNWCPEVREIAFLAVRNYLPNGPKEKEFLRLVRAKPVELTSAIRKRFAKQIAELSKLGIIKIVKLEPNAYGMMFSKLVDRSLLISDQTQSKYAGKWLPVSFWKKLLGPATYEQLLNAGIMKEELRLVKTRKTIIKPEAPQSDDLPNCLDDLPAYLRFLMHQERKTLVVFPSLQMARQYSLVLVQQGLSPIMDSGGYTRLVQQACVSRGAYLVVGTPRSLMRPWEHLENIIFVYQAPEDLFIRTATQRIPAKWILPPHVKVECIKPQPYTPVQIKNIAGLSDTEVLAYLRERLRPDLRQVFFVNRLGFSTSLQCQECGWVMHCPGCGTSMRYHRRLRRMLCHRCGQTESVPDRCPRCGSLNLEPMGIGLERLELQLEQKALKSMNDLRKATIVSSAKLFRYLPFSQFDEVFYVSADADLSSPTLIPELRFLKHLYYLRLWANPNRGLLEILTRDPHRIEEVMHTPVEQLNGGIDESAHCIELHTHQHLPNLEETTVWGPVPLPRQKGLRYFLLTTKKPIELLKNIDVRSVSFISFGCQ